MKGVKSVFSEGIDLLGAANFFKP